MSEPAEATRHLTLDEVAQRVRVTTMTIRRWVEKKQFPAPRRHGPRLIMWDVADIEAWEKSRKDSWN